MLGESEDFKSLELEIDEYELRLAQREAKRMLGNETYHALGYDLPYDEQQNSVAYQVFYSEQTTNDIGLLAIDAGQICHLLGLPKERKSWLDYDGEDQEVIIKKKKRYMPKISRYYT